VNFKFPARGVIEIRNVQGSTVADPINGPTDVITYDEYVPGRDGGGTTTTYQVTYSPATLVGTVGQNVPGGSHAPQGELDLVRLQMKSSAGATDFRPPPPLPLIA